MAGFAKSARRRATAEPSHPRLNNRTAAVLTYGLMILVLGLWQAAPHGFPTVCGGRPLLLVPLVTAIAMFTGPVGGGVAGAAAGLLWDMFSNRLYGFNALILLIVGCVVGLLVRLLLRNNLLSALMLCGGAVTVQALLDWLCNYLLPGRNGSVLLLGRTVLPNAVYTFLLALPVYGLVRGVTRVLKKRENA